MALVSWLTSVGGKLRILSTAPAKTDAAPAKMTMQSVSLKDLVMEVQDEQVRALAELPAELSIAFDKVFEAAGVKPPPHGWTIGKLEELLKTEQYKSMDRAAAQKAVLGILQAQKAAVEDLVKDAIARDQALESFAEFARKKMEVRNEARQSKMAEIKSQIAELQSQCQAMDQEAKLDHEHWCKWYQGKTAYEKEMAWALGYLMEKQIFTVDEDPD
jgi:hypothetical protein